MMKSAKRWGALLCVLLIVPLAEAQLTPSEARGRAIYYGEQGSALEQATASIGGMDVALPAKSFPCSSCHGEHGQGQAERGVAPSDLSQDALTRPYNVTAAAGRVRPPYTELLFRRAITEGIDSGGTELVDAMPRFNLPDEDVADLWAFLAKLKDERDPGISPDEIRIAIALPMSGPAEPTGVAMYGVMEVLSNQVNEAGGIHGRKLVFVPFDEPAGAAVPEDVFAILGSREPVTAIPTISTSFRTAPGPDGFALTSGLLEQQAALRQYAAETWGAVKVDEAQCDAPHSGTVLLTRAECGGDVAGADHILVPYPVFAETPPDIRRNWPRSVHVALPVQITKISGAAQAAFARTRSASRFSASAPLAQSNIYSSGVVAIDALMQSGRTLSRKKFKEKIEAMQGFIGAMTPPLTFSANDHVGSNGSLSVAYDVDRATLDAEGVWIDPFGEHL